MPNETKLLPCPFCHSEAKVECHDNHYQPSCSNEDCIAYDLYNEIYYPRSYEQAVRAWNTRHERTTRIVQGSEGTPFGENIVIPLVCEVCGHGISVKDNYCRTCGARIEEEPNA